MHHDCGRSSNENFVKTIFCSQPNPSFFCPVDGKFDFATKLSRKLLIAGSLQDCHLIDWQSYTKSLLSLGRAPLSPLQSWCDNVGGWFCQPASSLLFSSQQPWETTYPVCFHTNACHEQQRWAFVERGSSGQQQMVIGDHGLLGGQHRRPHHLPRPRHPSPCPRPRHPCLRHFSSLHLILTFT